jgi:hypothetical protein
MSEQERTKHLDALTKWMKETAWKWNKGMEQADDVRGAIISIGETYEELLGSEIELFSQEDPDATGFDLLMYVDQPGEKERDTLGPFRFEYVPGATDEQRKKYAEAMRAKREEAAKANKGG